jgi:predicted Zn-dependent protease
MSHLYRAAGAKDALDGRTVFSGPSGGTLAGRRLTTAPLTLRGNPGEKGLTCCPFAVARAGADTFTRASAGIESVFDNGLPLSPTRWIDDGVLTALVHTRHSAELTGLPLTPRIDNLIMEGPPGGPTLDELVASTRRGLLVTSLWYVREVDPGALLLTGLTRDGVHLVENGEVTGAVNNFRFDESPVGVLERVAEIGATERTLPREWDDDLTGMAMPALRVADFAMTAVTRAT